MKTSAAMFVGVLCLVGPAQGWAVPQDPPVELATGIRQVEDGDLETAVATLEKAIQQLNRSGARKRDLALAHAYLGVAHLGLDHHDRAHAALRDAWMQDNDLKLDDKKFPPRVRQLYEAARNEAREERRKAESAAKGSPAPTSAPETKPAAAAPAKAVPPVPEPRSATPAPAGLPPTAPAGASPVPGLLVGTRVRVAGPSTENKWVVGTVTSYDAGTVTIRRQDSGNLSVPVTRARFEVSEGRGSRSRRMLLWGLGGAAVLGGVGAAYGKSKIRDPFCEDFLRSQGEPPEIVDEVCGYSRGVGKWTAIGAAAGAVAGGAVGAVRSPEAWRPADRVGVGFDPWRGRVWVSVRF